jgi:hypothetical protein
MSVGPNVGDIVLTEAEADKLSKLGVELETGVESRGAGEADSNEPTEHGLTVVSVVSIDIGISSSNSAGFSVPVSPDVVPNEDGILSDFASLNEGVSNDFAVSNKDELSAGFASPKVCISTTSKKEVSAGLTVTNEGVEKWMLGA